MLGSTAADDKILSCEIIGPIWRDKILYKASGDVIGNHILWVECGYKQSDPTSLEPQRMMVEGTFKSNDPHAVFPSSHFRPKCFHLSKRRYQQDGIVTVEWRLEPNVGQILRMNEIGAEDDYEAEPGGRILGRISADMMALNQEQPLRYLALYSRNLITTKEV